MYLTIVFPDAPTTRKMHFYYVGTSTENNTRVNKALQRTMYGQLAVRHWRPGTRHYRLQGAFSVSMSATVLLDPAATTISILTAVHST